MRVGRRTDNVSSGSVDKKGRALASTELLDDEEQPTEPTQNRKDQGAQKKKRKKKRWSDTCLMYCCCFTCIGIIAFIAAVFVWMYLDEDEPRGLAMCGDCYCILDEDVTTCPEGKPIYDDGFVEELLQQTPLNAIAKMSCDAFDDDSCDFDPPRLELGDNAVCGIHYEDANCTKYKMKSYPNMTFAEDQGAFVTHKGECGLCSTTQDLAVE